MGMTRWPPRGASKPSGGGGDALGTQGGLLSWESCRREGLCHKERFRTFWAQPDGVGREVEGPGVQGGAERAGGAGGPLLLGAELRLPLWLRDLPCDHARAPWLALLEGVLDQGRGYPQYRQHLWDHPVPTVPSPACTDTRAPAAGPASQQTEPSEGADLPPSQEAGYRRPEGEWVPHRVGGKVSLQGWWLSLTCCQLGVGPPSQPQTYRLCGPRRALPLEQEGCSSGPGGFGRTRPASVASGSAPPETASGPCVSSEAGLCPATPPFSSQLPPPAPRSSLWPVLRRGSGWGAGGTMASTAPFPLATASNTAGWPHASVGKRPGPQQAGCSAFAAGPGDPGNHAGDAP